MNKTWQAITLMIGLALSLSQAAQCANKENASQKESVSKEGIDAGQENNVRAVLMALESALATANAEKAAALWSQDAIFIDEAGEETRGRKAIQERFDGLFKQNISQSQLGLHPERISLPADNVALVLGIVSLKNAQGDLPSTRFSMVLIKKDSTWLINEATETALQTVSSAEHLKELSWLIGEWQVNRDAKSLRLNVDWAPGKNFIVSKFTTNKADSAAQVDSQVIGWDPRSNNIVSWHFDNNGGFAYGKWSRQADQWSVEVAGVAADGSSTKATNVFTLKKANEFLWQSIHRSTNGIAVADTDQLSVQKLGR